jgi:Putative NADPH-quinone reductase (modulator of drug activity B)
MKSLVVFAHPGGKEFGHNHTILSEVIVELEKKGHEVIVRDLYKMNFKAILDDKDYSMFNQGKIPEDIALEQKYITESDNIIVIAPIWWTSLPAILKGYFDRVFAYGFAYSIDDTGNMVRLLSNKKGLFINTYGHSESYYQELGMLEAFRKTMDVGIFEYTGIEVVDHLMYGFAKSGNDQNGKKIILDVKDKVIKYFE